jgi:hypothetical protein
VRSLKLARRSLRKRHGKTSCHFQIRKQGQKAEKYQCPRENSTKFILSLRDIGILPPRVLGAFADIEGEIEKISLNSVLDLQHFFYFADHIYDQIFSRHRIYRGRKGLYH